MTAQRIGAEWRIFSGESKFCPDDVMIMLCYKLSLCRGVLHLPPKGSFVRYISYLLLYQIIYNFGNPRKNNSIIYCYHIYEMLLPFSFN